MLSAAELFDDCKNVGCICFIFLVLKLCFHNIQGSRDRQSLIPVTVKQIVTCDNIDDTFRIDGAELHMVKIVGTVLNLTEHATNFTYQVADSTGSIECKLWIDKETGAAARYEPNSLVKICGNLREYEGRKHVLVYDIKPVEDWNEITHHFLGTSEDMIASKVM